MRVRLSKNEWIHIKPQQGCRCTVSSFLYTVFLSLSLCLSLLLYFFFFDLPSKKCAKHSELAALMLGFCLPSIVFLQHTRSTIILPICTHSRFFKAKPFSIWCQWYGSVRLGCTLTKNTYLLSCSVPILFRFHLWPNKRFDYTVSRTRQSRLCTQFKQNAIIHEQMLLSRLPFTAITTASFHLLLLI
jgi:hypothetical protein